MESPKYLIIVTLIDGQNFTLPEGAPDRIEAFVYAEARFGNESILKSDPIKLSNSNPEFVTELAWQVDKRSLHQLRVERKAIKLQIFMQTREKKKSPRSQSRNETEHDLTNGHEQNDSTNQLDLIGYTIVDIRSAEETKQPKFQWVPLLNPKFRKSVYNRPEIQIAVTLSRLDEDGIGDNHSNVHSSTLLRPANNNVESRSDEADCSDAQSHETYDEIEQNENSRLYKTCLDFTLDSNADQSVERNEIIENDITIRSIGGCFYIYDTRDPEKCKIEDCIEHYKITVTIPFNSNLELLTNEQEEPVPSYFDIHLFGASIKTENFTELTSVETKEVHIDVYTTNSKLLTTYFELNSGLIIKLCQSSGETLGLTTIQLDQLCNSESKCRSIEGIFALQSVNDHDIQSPLHPTIGVSVVLERVVNKPVESEQTRISEQHIEMAKEHFGEDIDDYLYKTLNDTHQLTTDETQNPKNESIMIPTAIKNIEDVLKQDSHHFCFTIDLKNFSYTPNQRLIPTLRELVVRYSYPFFGYKDTITTDASIPISSTNSIIVSGFCEFNFATTADSLLAALKEIPLDLDILTCDHINLNLPERVIATCNLNLAQIMFLNEDNIIHLSEKPVSTTVSAPIYSIDGEEIGDLQVYLCLKDLGEPSFNTKSSVDTSKEINENVVNEESNKAGPETVNSIETVQLEAFMAEAKKEFEIWKEDFVEKFTEDVRKRETERFKRIHQRFEVKEAKREQDFKKKLEELNQLEKRLKNSFAYIDSLDKRLSNNFEILKAKDLSQDTRIDSLDLKISKAINEIKLNFDRKIDSLPAKYRRSCEDNSSANHQNNLKQMTSKISMKPTANPDTVSQLRRSSLRTNNTTTALPLPVRSSSLVRPNDGPVYRLVKRPTNIVTTVVTNGTSLAKPRSSSTRLNLSRETQEKLANLRREKAELLKRGCRPNDELIQEINSMIEKLAY